MRALISLICWQNEHLLGHWRNVGLLFDRRKQHVDFRGTLGGNRLIKEMKAAVVPDL
jgi:hypothetical protein